MNLFLHFPLSCIFLLLLTLLNFHSHLLRFPFQLDQEDFLHTNIVYPKHYFYVFRRTYSTVLQNNGKV